MFESNIIGVNYGAAPIVGANCKERFYKWEIKDNNKCYICNEEYNIDKYNLLTRYSNKDDR